MADDKENNLEETPTVTPQSAPPEGEQQLQSLGPADVEPQRQSVTLTDVEPQLQSVTLTDDEPQRQSLRPKDVEPQRQSVTPKDVEPQRQSLTLADVEPRRQSVRLTDVEPPLSVPDDNPPQGDLPIPLDKPAIEVTSSASPTADTSMKDQTEINEQELLHEQFDNYLRIANALMRTLKRPKDIEVCSDLLRRVQKLNNSRHLEVKRNNNHFFRYCLRVIKYTSDNQPLEYYRRMFKAYGDDSSDDKSTESRTWFEENKSYLASKTLKDGTFIVYTAVATEPKAGWQEGGLAILEKKGACGRF